MTEKRRARSRDTSELDWTSALTRLRDAQRLVQSGHVDSPEREREVLERRARELALEPDNAEPDDSRVEFVEFTMAHEHYGLESLFVKDVYPLRELTPLPGTPDFVMGIVNLRGRVISLVDLKKFFGLPDRGLSDTNHVVVLSSPEMEFGIVADVMLGVRSTLKKDLRRELPTFTGRRKEYLLGVAPDGVMLLDAQRILSDDGIIVRDTGID